MERKDFVKAGRRGEYALIDTNRTHGGGEKYISLEDAKVLEYEKNFFAYQADYAYLFDLLYAYCSDKWKGRDDLRIRGAGSLYYEIFLTYDDLVHFGIEHAFDDLADLPLPPGEKRRALARLHDIFIRKVGELMKKKTSIVWKSRDNSEYGGAYLYGQPIILTAKAEGVRKNAAGEWETYSLTRERPQNANLLVSGRENTQQATAQQGFSIYFSRDLFYDVAKNVNPSFVKFPRDLQAHLDLLKITDPNIFRTDAVLYTRDPTTGRYLPRTYDIQTTTARKFFSYLALHSNNLGGKLTFDTIDFFLHVNSRILKPTDDGEGWKLRTSYKDAKALFDTFSRIHSALLDRGVVGGMRYKTGLSFVDTTRNTTTFTVKPGDEADEAEE